MHGLKTLIRKELADHFTSARFVFLFALIAMVSLIMVYMAGLDIATNLKQVAKPRYVFLMLFTSSGVRFSLIQFVAFFGPLIGLILGFDAINRERNEGTLSKLLSQPLYRDAVINGKFLAGMILIAVMMVSIVLLISGMGLIVLGIVPGLEEILRMAVYLVISIVYISLWLAVAMLFSIVFRNVATSALAALAAWIFFSFFIGLGANAVASALTPDAGANNPAETMLRARIEKTLALTSPMELYMDSASTIIDPLRRTTDAFIQVGMMEQISMARFSGPLTFDQSVLIVLPHIVSLIAIACLCFAISYLVFMRQEIRSL